MAIRKRVWESARFGEKGLEKVTDPAYPERTYYFETIHAGRVVEKGSTYLGDMESAYWAMVWNPKTKSFEQVSYSNDREYGQERGWAAVDATPALAARWAADKAKRAAAYAKALADLQAERRQAEAAERARTPRRGSYVRVVKGRKIDHGREGTVYWAGPSAWGDRVGIQFTDGSREFTAIGNVEVLRQPAD